VADETSKPAPRSGRPPDVTLKIPRPLYERLAQVIEGTGFRSVTEFSVYVLRDLVAAQEATHHEAETELSREEVDVVRRRLQALGYLDG
jgi:hypothetical protein